jgi:hypothetical protein
MTDPMNEERARLLCSPGRMIEMNDKPRHEPALDEFLIAKGYLERVKQESAIINAPMKVFNEMLEPYKEAIEAADRMADAHKHPTRDYCVQCQLRDEYRAARAKIYPNPYRRRYIRPEPKPVRESVCIRCFKPFDSTAYNNLVNRVCQVCTKKLDKGEPGK